MKKIILIFTFCLMASSAFARPQAGSNPFEMGVARAQCESSAGCSDKMKTHYLNHLKLKYKLLAQKYARAESKKDKAAIQKDMADTKAKLDAQTGGNR